MTLHCPAPFAGNVAVRTIAVWFIGTAVVAIFVPAALEKDTVALIWKLSPRTMNRCGVPVPVEAGSIDVTIGAGYWSTLNVPVIFTVVPLDALFTERS